MTTTIGSLDLNSANSLYTDATQYFWFESDSTATYGAGVHITLSPSATFMSNPTGQNILINTDGISIRNGLLPMMTLDNGSLNFNVVDTANGIYTKVASFGTNTTIGSTTTNRILLNQSYILFRSPTNYMLRSIDNTTIFRDAIYPYEDGEPIFAWEANESGSKTYEWFYTTFIVANLTGQITLTCKDYTNNTEFTVYRIYNNGVADTTQPSGWTINVTIPQGTDQLLELTVIKSATGNHVEVTNIEFEYITNFNTSTLSCGTYCHYDSSYSDLQGATPAFVVGIGQSDANRLDGFFVGYNGDVKVGKDLYLGTAELEKGSGLGGYIYGAGGELDVITAGEIYTRSGAVTHSSPIGTPIRGNFTASVSNGTSLQQIYPSTGKIDMPAGSWIINYSARFPSSTTGRRGASIYINDGSMGSSYSLSPPVNGEQTALTGSVVYRSGSDFTVGFGARQNSGSTQTVTVYWDAMRIA